MEAFSGTDRGRQHIRCRIREVGLGIPRVAELFLVVLVFAAFVEFLVIREFHTGLIDDPTEGIVELG